MSRPAGRRDCPAARGAGSDYVFRTVLAFVTIDDIRARLDRLAGN